MTTQTSKHNDPSTPADWDGLLREFAKQQDAHISARKSANQSKRGTGYPQQNGTKAGSEVVRRRSIDVVDDLDNSDEDDFEGFEEYSHRLGYLDSVTSQNLEEKMMSTTSTPASSRVPSRTLIPRPNETKASYPKSTSSPNTSRKKTNLSRKLSDSVDSLVMMPKRNSDSFIVPTDIPIRHVENNNSSDRKARSGGELTTSNRMKNFNQSETIEINKPRPITFKRSGMLIDDSGAKIAQGQRSNGYAGVEEGLISQMVDQFISVIKKHGEVLQQGNKISFVVKNKTHITSEKMERISYTLRHAKRVLARLKKVTGMDFELIDETNGTYQAALKDASGRYKVLPPITSSNSKNNNNHHHQQQQANNQGVNKQNLRGVGNTSTERERQEVPLRTYEDYKKLPDPTLRGGLSTGPAISYEQQQIMAAKAQKMREYDEAVRLHNYDKFNHSPSFQSNPTANNRGRGGGGMGAMMVDQGGPARSLTGGDLSKVQELELAQFLHQRDAKLRQSQDFTGGNFRQPNSLPTTQSGSRKHPQPNNNNNNNNNNFNHNFANSNQQISTTTQSKNQHQSEAFLQLVERDKQRKQNRRKLSCDSNDSSHSNRSSATLY